MALLKPIAAGRGAGFVGALIFAQSQPPDASDGTEMRVRIGRQR